ncbi:armadillo-type protein [Mycena rebaudengoi]|nr:armadillo-type protein [Mycena rebaudengoi]
MAELNRHPTRESDHSDWSDSKPLGATMSIHAAAKPLMRFMYHRQALTFVKQNQDIPFSADIMDTYASYLGCKYVSSSTKATVLKELWRRAQSEGDSSALVDSAVGTQIVELLASPYAEVRIWSSRMIARLACYELSAVTVLHLCPYPGVAALLRDSRKNVVESATLAMAKISSWPDGARALTDTAILHSVHGLLDSKSAEIREQVCRMVGNLASHEQTAVAVLRASLQVQLVTLLRDNDSNVIEAATFALSQIASRSDGAKALMRAGALDLVAELFESSSPKVRAQTRILVENLARHGARELTIPLFEKPCMDLISLFRRDMSLLLPEALGGVLEDVIFALSEISAWSKGAEAILAIGALDFLANLIASRNARIQEHACRLVGNLASHKTTAMELLQGGSVLQLVALLHNTSANVAESAAIALSNISVWLDGATAKAVVDAGALDLVADLLQSSSAEIRAATCRMIRNLVGHECTMPIVLGVNPCLKLVGLLWDNNSDVAQSASAAILQVSFWRDGLKAIAATGVLDRFKELVALPSIEVREQMCQMLANVTRHRDTGVAVVGVGSWMEFLSLLRDRNVSVVESASLALSQIVCEQDGAKSIVDAMPPDVVTVFVQSPRAEVRGRACRMIAWLATHELTAPHVVEFWLRDVLGLLHDKEPNVVELAMFALSQISFWWDGAEALLDARVLDRFKELIRSPNPTVRSRMCRILANLSRHASTAVEVLGWDPSMDLVPLIRDSNFDVVYNTIFALTHISRSVDGAKSIVDAGIGDLLVGLVAPPMREVDYNTIFTLTHIPRSVDGTKSIVDASVGDSLIGMVAPRKRAVRELTCCLLKNLAGHASTAAVAETLCLRLVALSRNINQQSESAVYVLDRVSQWPEGERVVTRAKVSLHHLTMEIEDAVTHQQERNYLRDLSADLTSDLPTVALSRNINQQSESAVYALDRVSQWPEGVAGANKVSPHHLTMEIEDTVTQHRQKRNYLADLSADVILNLPTATGRQNRYTPDAITSSGGHDVQNGLLSPVWKPRSPL